MRFDEQHRANLQTAQKDRVAKHRAERLEDVNWLAETGECMTGAARRLGLSYGALDHWCRRHAPEQRLVMLARDYRGYTNERWAS